jgi:ATP-dependent RNA circularization protein (DNA/RNA ligase family)
MCEVIWLPLERLRPSDEDLEWAAYELGAAFLSGMAEKIKPVEFFEKIGMHLEHLSDREYARLDRIVEFCAESLACDEISGFMPANDGGEC